MAAKPILPKPNPLIPTDTGAVVQNISNPATANPNTKMSIDPNQVNNTGDNPAPHYHTSVKFNPDGTVEYNGTHLSEREYSGMLGGAGDTNAKVQGLQYADKIKSDKIALQQKEAEAKFLTVPELQAQKLEQQQTADTAISQLGQLTPEQQSRTIEGSPLAADVLGATQGGITGAVSGGIGGAGTGAAIGAAVGSVIPGAGTAAGAGVGAIIGGSLGTLVGGVTGVFTAISADEKRNVAEAYKVYSTAKANMRYYTNMANKGAPAEMVKDGFNEAIADMEAAYDNIHKENSDAVGYFTRNGIREETEIKQYLDTMADKKLQFEMAILKPNPNAVYWENS